MLKYIFQHCSIGVLHNCLLNVPKSIDYKYKQKLRLIYLQDFVYIFIILSIEKLYIPKEIVFFTFLQVPI